MAEDSTNQGQTSENGGTELEAKLKAAADAAEKAKAELKAMKDADAKTKAEAAAKAKAEANAKAIADGEAQKLLAAREAELEAERNARKEIEQMHRERIDRQIAKLPEAARAKVDAVKDALPLAKLEVLVEAELEQSTKPGANPPPNRTPGTPAGKEGAVKLSAEARGLLDTLNVSTGGMDEMTVVHDKVLNTTKFVMPINSMIKKLAGMVPARTRLTVEAYTKRYGKA